MRRILIMSGKGGVGKSTISTRIAHVLAENHEVGLLDADVTGPNIPKMCGVENEKININGLLRPVIGKYGLKIISMAFFISRHDQAIVWKGEKQREFLEQCINSVEWGDIDYLIVDLPPGTGDSVRAMMEVLPKINGVVIVTTPQNVSLLDCEKAIDMCKHFNLPLIGVIENMSGFECPHCNGISDIFDKGGGKKLAEHYKIPFLGEVPINPRIREEGDNGNPFQDTDSQIFKDISKKITKWRLFG